MLKNFELIIFDLDGVLIDSKGMYLYIFQKVLAKEGYHYSYEQIEHYIGQKTGKVISDLIPMEDERREEKIERAKEYADKISISEEGYSKVVLLSHAKETIEELSRRNYTLTLLTNSDRIFVEAVLKRFSLKNSYWSRIIAADDEFESKEEAANYLVNYFKTTPDKTAYIADMIKDVEIARKVGCKIIAIPGWHTEKMLREALVNYGFSDQNLIRSLKELV